MPTLLVPTLAVVALLPLTTSRPPPDQVDDTNLLPSAATTAIVDNLLSCIEEDTTLVDRLRTCMEHDFLLEENTNDGNDGYFGLLDEDWNRLQLLQREFPADLHLKGNLVRVFRKLLGSLYRAYFARLRSNVEAHRKVSPDNANKNDYLNEIKGSTRDVDDRTDTPVFPGESPLSPTSTDEAPSEHRSSNEIILDEAGSDPQHTYVNPAPENVSNSIPLDTDGPYGVSDSTSENSSHGNENNEISTFMYEGTTSELDSPTTKSNLSNNSFDSDSYRSTTRKSITTTISFETAEMKRDSIIVSEAKDSVPTTFSLDRNMGSDIDENELFLPMKTTTSAGNTEEEVSTKEFVDSSADDKIDNRYNTDSNENKAEGISPTEDPNHSSQYAKSLPNDAYVPQNHNKQTDQTTELSYVASTPDLNSEGKENGPDTEYSSGPVSHSVAKTLPADPTILSTSVPYYNTALDKDTDDENMEPLPITPNVGTVSEKQVIYSTSTRPFSDDEIVLDNQPLTNFPERQHTNEVTDITEGYTNISYYHTTDAVDSTHLFGTEMSAVQVNQLSSISTVPSVNEPFDREGGRGENKDYQTEISNIDTTNSFTPQETKSPRDSVTYPFENPQFTIGVASTQGAYSNKYDEDKNSYDTKGTTIKWNTDAITSQQPDLNDPYEHREHTVIDSSNGNITSPIPVSENDSDRNSPSPDVSVHKGATTTESGTAVSLTPQSKSQDDFSMIDDNKSNTKTIYDIESTTDNNIIPNINGKTIDIERGDTTESLNKFHSFSIPLPEVRKAKQSNVIINTLRIFPADNEHRVIFQPSYNRGCLSNNDCVRVGRVVNRNAKQRRAPSAVVGVEVGGAQGQHPEGDLDSVLWWHKMRALKKKFR